ncbi:MULTISPECIES: ABC transporter ATP-binding protein [Stenotrophomonas]|uniref:ABC transporter ATP-binding protein n=1 Tax=Stenotrophomonas bentonitica TaxID=1450134 RepID=A0ABU9JMA4_9GAMM|nr:MULTISPECIES: ABC transporter ATP-binding protein [Stenotrophomonas]MDX5516761.1 ABC transporter ATP-binding protein [Stenotrophomonas sp. RG-453]
MLRMQGLSKVFQVEQVRTHALREVDLHVGEGEFLAVTGPSGSGKSTLLNIAGLLEGVTTGTYTLDGRDVSTLSDGNRSRIRNEKVGFIFQGFNLIPDLTLYDNVDVPLRYRGLGVKERTERIIRVLQRVGLGSRMHHFPRALSGGQQQRAAIARALAGRPRLLLADEPTGNLDAEMAGTVMELLQEINAGGATIIMVTHDPDLALKATRNVHFVDGTLSDRFRLDVNLVAA